MAPEVNAAIDQQSAMANYSRQADIWSLGMSLFFVFEGHIPFIPEIEVCGTSSSSRPLPLCPSAPSSSSSLPRIIAATLSAVATAAAIFVRVALYRCQPSPHVSPL